MLTNSSLSSLNFNALPFHLVGKLVLVVFLLIYIVFSLLVIRQVAVMNRVLETKEHAHISNLARLQLFFALFVTAAALLIF